jgi:hypothetical protein
MNEEPPRVDQQQPTSPIAYHFVAPHMDGGMRSNLESSGTNKSARHMSG